MAGETCPVTVHLMGNAHIDLVYRWRWSETVERLAPETFASVLELLAKEPGFTFVQSQLCLYEAMEQHHPELFGRMREAVAGGRWAVVGGWCEYDHMLTGEEAIVRHYLLAAQYMRRAGLGERILVDWCPDAFSGHAATLPSILAGCGIRYLLMIRGVPKGMPAFFWEGPDGSRILVCQAPLGYGIALSEKVLEAAAAWQEQTGLRDMLVLYGMGDHGGGPNEKDLEVLALLRAQAGAPRFVHSLPAQFFAALESQLASGRVHRGELPDSSRGAYTSCAANKRQICLLEHELLVAERLAALATLWQRKPVYPRVELDSAWAGLLRHTFHDDLPGTARRPVYQDNRRELRRLRRDVRALQETALAELGARLDTRGEGVPIVVFNPCPWPRTGPVEVALQLPKTPQQLSLVDGRGNATPVQVISRRNGSHWSLIKLAFVARDLPPLGYRLYRLFPTAEAVASDLSARPLGLENSCLRLELDGTSGNIVSLLAKESGQEVLAGPANVLQLLPEDPTRASAWIYWPTGAIIETGACEKVRLVEHGPVRATLAVDSILGDSRLRRYVTLYSGLPQVYLRTVCDWRERDAALKVAFPLARAGRAALYGMPFGHVLRQADGAECAAHRFAWTGDGNGGVAILNRGIFGHDYEGSCLRLTLLRGIGDLDPTADVGRHEFHYALWPHGAGVGSAAVAREALAFNLPILARQELKRAGVLSPWGAPGLKAALPPELGLLRLEPESAVLTALKLRQGQWTRGPFILRLFEAQGQPCTATLTFPAGVAYAVPVDHLEEPLAGENDLSWEGEALYIPLRAHEIRSVEVELAAFGLGLETSFAGPAMGWENG